MANPRYPGAVWNPGVNAGYPAGRNLMLTAVRHYTVGIDSTGIGLQGYFTFLISRDGRVQQFAEVDAITWHAGPYNTLGPGIEVEYLDEPDIFTPEAEAATKLLVEWLASEWGLPTDQYVGPRIPMQLAPNGWIDHSSIEQTEEHFDYWPQPVWEAITKPAPLPPPPVPELTEEQPMFSIVGPDGVIHYWFTGLDFQIYRIDKPKGGDWGSPVAVGKAGAPKPAPV